jgi:ATP-binding cassette subfamily B protein
MEALEHILALPPAPRVMNPEPLGVFEQIDFSGVSFTYPSRELPALQNISLTLRAGTSLALVGPSGSGKTTITKLLVGLYPPSVGEIRVNGIPASRLDFDLFRRRIGYVSQDTQLFAGTIRENLLFVRPTATDAECLLAIEHAAATPILSRTGDGLDTRIGESGIRLSGGERQRLAIARALLRDPELIIFDEATSSLDSLTEKSITDTIRTIGTLRPNLMIVMVAHRLSTILHADTIYVLERGSITEQGNHETLLRTQGLYAALWREQRAE